MNKYNLPMGHRNQTCKSALFVVPGDKTLAKEGKQYSIYAEKPGVVKKALKMFAEIHRGKDIKTAFDGKKLNEGYGKNMGEEDLGGFETSPTLEERRERLEKELSIINKLLETLTDKMIQDTDLDNVSKCTFVNSSVKIIGILSQRIKELRQLVLKKKNALHNLMKKVDGDWRKSSFSNAVSFIQTKIIQRKHILFAFLTEIYMKSALIKHGGQYILNGDSNFHK